MTPKLTPLAGRILEDIQIRSPAWKAEPASKQTVRTALAAIAATIALQSKELCIVLADDETIRALNRQWRGIDKPTNVLSFPAPVPRRGAARHLGDIVIAYETAAKEARAERKPFHHHLAHLALHGFLHLLGYDHESDRQAEAMERHERRILARLGVPDPYATRDADV